MKPQSKTKQKNNWINFLVGDIFNKINRLNAAEIIFFLKVKPSKIIENFAFVGTSEIYETGQAYIVGETMSDHGKSIKNIPMYVSPEFKLKVVQPLVGKEVKLSKKYRLGKFRLLKEMQDDQMFDEIRHKPIPVLKFLPMIWDMLNAQNKGQKGILLANGKVNIFHIKLKDKKVFAIRVRWDGKQWRLVWYKLNCHTKWEVDSCLFVSIGE